MGQDLEAVAAQQVHCPVAQQYVLEDPAGQGNGRHVVLVARLRAGLGDDLRDRVVEPPGDHRGRHACEQVFGDGSDELGAGRDAVLDRGRIAALFGGVGQLLELDGGLAFVVHRVPDSDQGGCRVEKPANT
jgi:hypothetical protein